MPSANDVYITPASKKIDFYDSSSIKGKLYYHGGYFRMYSDTVPIAFEGDSGNHYFISSGESNRLYVYNYSAGTGYATYAADFLQLRDGSSNIEVSLVAGNGSFISGNLGVGTGSASEKLHVVGNGLFTGANTVLGASNANQNTYLKVLGSGAGYTSAGIKLLTYNGGDRPGGVYSYAHAGTQAWYSGPVYGASYKWGVNYKSSIANTGSGLEEVAAVANNLFIIDKTGQVGIGTTSPSYPLHIYGAATQEVRIQATDSGAYSRVQFKSHDAGYGQLNFGDSAADTAGGLVYTHSTDTLNIRAANSNIANVTATGVGIGTTSPAKKLHITGTSEVARFEATEVSIGLKTTRVGDKVYFLGAGNPDGDFVIASGTSSDNIWASSNADTVIRLDGTSGDLHLLPSGNNVGIGTTAPARSLEVKANGAYMAFNSTATDNHQFTIGSDNSGFIVYDDTLSTYRFVIDQDSGSVGIGTTGPDRELHVHKASTSVGLKLSNDSTGQGSADGFYIDMGATDVEINNKETGKIAFATANSTRMTIDSAGDVGIGTTAPSYTIDVVKNEADHNYVAVTNTSAGTSSVAGFRAHSQTADLFLLGNADNRTTTKFGVTQGGYSQITTANGNGLLFGNTQSAPIIFGTNDTERMRILSGGNVGIGTTSPSAKLHVQGTSKLNDWVYLSGSASQRIGGYDTQIWSIANGGTTPATVRHVFATSLNWDNNVELRYQIPSTVGDGSGVLKFGQIQKNNTNYSHGETQFFTSGAARLTINKQGRVGINTTSPSHGLTVFNTDFYLNSGDMHISQNKYFKNANDGGQSHGFPSSGKYVFNNVDVGIGTSAPAQKLDVNGATQTGELIVTGSTLAVQRTMKNDVSGDFTLSTDYSHYKVAALTGDAPTNITVTLTTPANPRVGDEYTIVTECGDSPAANPSFANTYTATVRIIANTSQTINTVSTNININSIQSATLKYNMAKLICIDTNTFTLIVSDIGPVA